MGSKKKAALHGVSKRERAALEARAAEIAAELKAREKAAAKKKAKKRKPAKPEPVKKIDRSKVKKAKARPLDVGPIGLDPTMIIVAESEAPIEIVPEPADDRTTPLGGDDLKAALEADTAKAVETDAAIKARVQAKRAIRLGLPDPDSIDRNDADAVRAYNAEAVKVGAVLLTSTDEREAIETRAVKAAAAAVEAIAAAVEVVETEAGREFVAGPSVTADAEPTFAKPSEAPKSDFVTNGNGQYLVKRPSDGKLVGYTRVTSYIKGIEDQSGIEKWKLRVLLEGVAAVEESGDPVTARVRDLVHNRDLAIAKARKADRKGKLAHGELATYTNGAWADFKKALNALADEVFEIGGGREKASHGTDLHALFELHDTEGMQAVADLLTVGQITPADMADVEAYADLIATRGIRFVDIERVVVNDNVPAPTPTKPDRTTGVAGRLDRTGYVKLPGETRARKRVLDIKTGSLEYSAGEIARQLAQYAGSVGYDLDTHEREDLKLDQRIAVVIHVPAGTGTATLYSVDLTKGRKGLRIIGDMRAFRNEGKTALAPVNFSATAE